jgi:hypothetical protein
MILNLKHTHAFTKSTHNNKFKKRKQQKIL